MSVISNIILGHGCSKESKDWPKGVAISCLDILLGPPQSQWDVSSPYMYSPPPPGSASVYVLRSMLKGKTILNIIVMVLLCALCVFFVQYYLPRSNTRQSLLISYYMPRNLAQPRWVLGNWSPCSVTCGTGKIRGCFEMFRKVYNLYSYYWTGRLNLLCAPQYLARWRRMNCIQFYFIPWFLIGSQQRRVHCYEGNQKVRTRNCRKNSTTTRPSESARIRRCQAERDCLSEWVNKCSTSHLLVSLWLWYVQVLWCLDKLELMQALRQHRAQESEHSISLNSLTLFFVYDVVRT